MGEFSADLNLMKQIRTDMIEPAVQQMQDVTLEFHAVRAYSGGPMFGGGLGATAAGFLAKYAVATGRLADNQDALFQSLQDFAGALQKTEEIYRAAEGQNTENITGAR